MYIPPDIPTRNSYDPSQADPIDSEPILIQGPSTSEPPIDTNMNLADAPQDDNRRHGKQRKALAKKIQLMTNLDQAKRQVNHVGRAEGGKGARK